MYKQGWMVRAGEGGRLFEDFEKGYVAIGWGQFGDYSHLKTREAIAQAYNEKYSDQKEAIRPNSISALHKFSNVMNEGDLVVSYDPQARTYLVGDVAGPYSYSPDTVGNYPQIRPVNWLGKVGRDQLSQKARNSLGSVLTLFSLKEFVINELVAALRGESIASSVEEGSDADSEEDAVQSTREDVIERSKELIKDRIVSLDADEMEQLVAAVLRGMGFRTRVSAKGPDRGVDVLASPDGLGLQEPRIKVEVKHREGSSGSQMIRGFIGALRQGDKGIFVSTGGFSREAKYEAERANIPVTLVDIDTLADLVVDYYEDFDLEGKALVPLVRLYWPAE